MSDGTQSQERILDQQEDMAFPRPAPTTFARKSIAGNMNPHSVLREIGMSSSATTQSESILEAASVYETIKVVLSESEDESASHETTTQLEVIVESEAPHNELQEFFD